MGIFLLKKRVNRDQCSFATKQRMFGVFAIDEILRYRGTRFPGSRTLCHPAPNEYAIFVPHYQSLNRRLDHLDENVERLWSKLSTKDEASNSLALGKVIILTCVYREGGIKLLNIRNWS